MSVILCMLHKVPFYRGTCPECELMKLGPNTYYAQKMDKAWHDALIAAASDLYICPNNGRVIETGKGDDKVVCNCGKKSPFEKRGMIGLHQAKFLKPATAEQFWEQNQKDLKKHSR